MAAQDSKAPSRYTEDSMYKANEYLEKHRIMELFSDLAAAVAFHKPANVRAFLMQELALREREGTERGLFEEREIDAVFNMSDLMQTGSISQTQCREALLSLAGSQKQYEDAKSLEIPEEVDVDAFRERAKIVLSLE